MLAACHRAAAAEKLLFPDRKIKIPGENMPILQKEIFSGRESRDSDLHSLLPCRQNAVAWAKRPGLINGALFTL